MQFAMHHIDIIAKCNPNPRKFIRKPLILLIIFSLKSWHAGCITPVRANPLQNQFQAKVTDMNMTLSLLNAAALVALVAFHFHDAGSKTETVAVQAQPHYLIKQAPRYAAMPTQHSDAMLANDTDEAIPVDRSERWVF
jgi:hypothetical protein